MVITTVPSFPTAIQVYASTCGMVLYWYRSWTYSVTVCGAATPHPKLRRAAAPNILATATFFSPAPARARARGRCRFRPLFYYKFSFDPEPVQKMVPAVRKNALRDDQCVARASFEMVSPPRPRVHPPKSTEYDFFAISRFEIIRLSSVTTNCRIPIIIHFCFRQQRRHRLRRTDTYSST